MKEMKNLIIFLLFFNFLSLFGQNDSINFNEIRKKINVMTIKNKDLFKDELKKRSGFTFKIYENYFIRLGIHNKYLIEGKYELKEIIITKSFPSNVELKINIVNVTPEYSEGKIQFDATVSPIDARPYEYMCFFLPNSHNDIFLKIIKEHEINHIRTNELIKNKTGELNSFYSEILADVLWLNEVDSKDLITLKQNDVNTLLESNNLPNYYRKYLKIIQSIIFKDNYKFIAKDILEKAIKNEFEYESIEEIEKEIFKLTR
ncbi:hypothetical protein ACSV4D_09245 [Flavobacterium sp. ARAG 55.4]|uniref:hypothetical protein n=1 Tax=Flavobacterium sp. ARAG 55.4 TaxID=3451357 RepID=UPI003F46E132